jgi:poly(3-hydroxybutyrate) depolymerase
MKFLSSALFSMLFFVISAEVSAQVCDGVRYKDQIFTNVDVTEVTYTTANSTNLKLDVYQPQGDTETNRPLIILAHGGSFIGGNKTADATVTTLCENFAKRGYVTASINYRLGGPLDMLVLNSAITVVVKAISDGKAAIRYFRKNVAENGNTFGINPNMIFVGGNSAGAVLYLHHAYISEVSEAPQSIQTVLNQNGGIEGNSGNDGYSSAVSGVINLAGGLNEVDFIDNGEAPVISFHGDADDVVPYYCADAQGGVTPVQLCGLGALQPRLTSEGIDHVSKVYTGAGHTPWQSNAAMMVEIDSMVADFLFEKVCNTTSIAEIAKEKTFSIYPNPTNGTLNIEAFTKTTKPYSVKIFDASGRMVWNEKNINETTTALQLNLTAGIYRVMVHYENANQQIFSRNILFQ